MYQRFDQTVCQPAITKRNVGIVSWRVAAPPTTQRPADVSARNLLVEGVAPTSPRAHVGRRDGIVAFLAQGQSVVLSNEGPELNARRSF